jgi:peptide deformylase
MRVYEVESNKVMLAIREAVKEHVDKYSDDKIEKIFKNLRPSDQAYNKYATKRVVVAVNYMNKVVKIRRADSTYDVVVNEVLGIDKDMHLFMIKNPKIRVDLKDMDDYIADKNGCLSVIINILKKYNLV